MILMVLDHVRGFFFNGPSPTDLNATNGFLFTTRFVTHFCAPVFVFLAGTAAYIYGTRNKGRDLQKFLLSRGLWLVVLEFTIIKFGWSHQWSSAFGGGVIWAIGASMVLLAAICLLSPLWVFGVGATIVIFHTGLSPLIVDSLAGIPQALAQILLLRGSFEVFGMKAYMYYAVIPWFGVMALGYGFGAIYLNATPAGRRRLCTRIGMVALLSFLVLRGFNLYGDPVPWQTAETFSFSVISFFNLSKYPPSLLYILITLGPALWLLPHLEFWAHRPFFKLNLTFGRVPMMFYILHIYMISYGASLTAYALNEPYVARQGLFTSLPVIWGIWVVAVLLLAPVCTWYAGYKKRHNHWWLSYL